MHKTLTYFWLIMFASSLNSAFVMNPDLQIKGQTSKLSEMACCCDHAGAENCSKSCCNENQKSTGDKDCMGHCGYTGNHCSSVSIHIVVPPKNNLIALSEFIGYTFESPNFGYLESIPQPITMPIWQPPQIG